eukprot:CAMPEP_0204863458 /NCGR_PEP_ID=MMETSP1348-20121228/3333_1 /ASSEMBLY_ACC=CAM_ASM_000700 /TAXON_ID=215587 /ORGANISM="Aplanochytrium stocchinoi, Strain GSBS06" /LENGTH=560 /DNA_ID=CAMNT_0052013793 /DNA_START=331 /DNA_END=2013 /DNA_ORIENTATION=-
MTEPVKTSEEFACGHELPDNFMTVLQNGDSYETPIFEKSHKYQTFEHDIHLISESEGLATICILSGPRKGCVNGTWTMVYDEAIIVKSPDYDLLMFLQYEIKPEFRNRHITSMENLDYFNSLCTLSFSGWWSEGGTKDKGCAIGRNISPVEKAKIHSSEMRMEGEKSTFMVSPSSLLQLQSRDRVRHRHRSGNRMSLVNAASEDSEIKTFLDEEWKVDIGLINYINSNNFGWTAHKDSAKTFAGMSRREVFKMGGRHRYHYNNADKGTTLEKVDVSHEVSITLNQMKDETAKKNELKRRQCIEEKMPKQFTWQGAQGFDKDIMTPVVDQGSCGSCYAEASVDAATIRYRIAHYNSHESESRSVVFSVDEVLNCAPQNQGCDGGYPDIVGFYAKHIGLITKDCSPNFSSNDDNKKECKTDCKRYYAHDFDYVSGSAWKVSVADMMKDIIENGPIAVAVDATDELFVYQSGVFNAVIEDSDVIVSSTHKSFWEKTTHAVMIVGWDEISWIVKNSWGPSWGDNGYFRLKRGVNEIAVEALPTAIYFTESKRPANKNAPDVSEC